MSTKRSSQEQHDADVHSKKTKGDHSAAVATLANGKDATHDGDLKYLAGWGNYHSSEALPGAVPKDQNNPQSCAYNLIAEQLSGTSFTTPRVKNQKLWLYRILPSCVHLPYKRIDKGLLVSDFSKCIADPNQKRWKPFPFPPADQKVDFVRGLKTIGGAGSVETKTGFGVHIYTCNTSMTDTAFSNSDGDLLIVPQEGTLTVRTECGVLRVPCGEIVVIPRCVRFSVAVEGPSRGYACEVFTGHFIIPDLGPIGANGLADPRHFEIPTASYENRKCTYTMLMKYAGDLFETTQDHSPFDIVGWHGNYVPYKYNLDKFITINSVSVDHMDPSIFTVLTCQTNEPGVAALDFVIFPPRWAVQMHTFRPPYYHRNVMSEFMGNLRGAYDAKPNGFAPGAGSLHNVGIGHGPDANSYEQNTSRALNAEYMENQLAFMFESTYLMKLTPWAQESGLDEDYYKCWQGIPNKFTGP